jgi:putative transposase
MARPLRVHIPGALYHVMSRGNARQRIFYDREDYIHFLARLSVASKRFGVRCWAYCMMLNHFHLLLQAGELPLWRMMQQLNSSYGQRFNRRHERIGHVLQGRFKAPLVDGDSYLRRVLRYIALNPVRAGLVAHPADWPWSSYRATAGLLAPPPFLALDRAWAAFDPEPSIAQAVFAAFVAAGPSMADRPADPIASCSATFRARVSEALEPHRGVRDFIYAERFACRPPLEQLIDRTTVAAALDLAMRDAFENHGYTAREIGEFVGRPAATVWRRIRRAAERLATADSGGNAKIEI